MSSDPVLRFLGVERNSHPLRILSLTPDACEVGQVQLALRARLKKIDGHPDAESADAEEARMAVRGAAAKLKDPKTRRELLARFVALPARPKVISAPLRPKVEAAPPEGDLKSPEREFVDPASLLPGVVTSRSLPSAPIVPKFHLTPFDRQVLAVLVAGGGWNAASRARLVVLAAANRVTVQGLLKVITGLSEYARARGPRLGVEQITAGAGRFEEMPTAPILAKRVGASAAARLTAPLDQFTRDLKEDSAWATAKLAMLFSLVILLVGLVVVQWIFSGLGPSRGATPAPTAVVEATRPPVRPPRPSRAVHMPSFPEAPTFRIDAPPAEAVAAADHAPRLPDEIDAVARRIVVAAGDPSEATFREWNVFMDIAGACWVIIDDDGRQSIDDGIIEVLYASADAPSVSDRLLEAFLPPTGQPDDPVEIWRGAWSVGTSARIARHPGLSPSIVDRARAQLESILDDGLTAATPDFNAAARAWLDRVVPSMVDVLEFSPAIYSTWDAWLAAQRQLGAGEPLQESLMHAVAVILDTEIDLARPGPSADVLGRLLGEADFRTSRTVREAVRGFFDDRENIASHDLWVLTGILAQYDAAPWFGDDLVLAESADRTMRNRFRDRIDAAWPSQAESDSLPEHIAEGHGVQVDPGYAASWSSTLDRVMSQGAPRDDRGLLHRLLQTARLNQVAGRLAAHDNLEAFEMLSWVESPDAFRSVPIEKTPGQAIGRDGQWAATYREMGRNAADRTSLLASLRSTAGTDMGPIDAEVLVREMYRGGSGDIRATAQAVIVQLFGDGPNICLEMHEQLLDAPISEGVSGTIARVTNTELPSTRSSSWKASARLALARHTLGLLDQGRSLMDLIAAELSHCYLDQLQTLDAMAVPAVQPTHPQDASALLLDAWRRLAESMMVSTPTPVDPGTIAQRHALRTRLAAGPIEQHVANRLAALDLIAYVTVAERPGAELAVTAVMHDSAERRRDALHVFEQAAEVELAIARIWRIRFEESLRNDASGGRT